MNTALHRATQGLSSRNTTFKITSILQVQVRGRCLYVVYNLMCLIKKKPHTSLCFLSVGYILKKIFHVRMI